MDSGSRASLTFTGTGVSWILYRDEWSGIANVYLDGVLKSAVDTYASPFLLRQGFRRAFSASSRVYGHFSGPKDGMV